MASSSPTPSSGSSRPSSSWAGRATRFDPGRASGSTGTLHVDLSGVGSRRLQAELRGVFARETSGPIREREGAWRAPPAWVHQYRDRREPPALLFADLSCIREALDRESSPFWVATSRRRRLRVVGFVPGRVPGDQVVGFPHALRSLDGRLSLVAEPRFTPLKRSWDGAERCVQEALFLFRPEALLTARFAPELGGFLLRFGDGRVGVVEPERIAAVASAGELALHAATVTSNGRTLHIPASGSRPEEGLTLEGALLRSLVEQGRARSARTQAELEPGTPVGPRIRAARRARELSQRALGARIGMDQSVISNLERGRQSPRVQTLERVAGGLDMTLDELLGVGAEGD